MPTEHDNEGAVKDLAGKLFDLCDTKQRQDGTPYVSSTDDRVLKVTYAAHGDGWHLPCDWHWLMTRSALGAIHDGDLTDDPDTWGEWADGEVDMYNAARRRWLTDCGQYDAAECAELLGDTTTDIDRILGVAQYVELMRVAGNVVEAVQALVDES